MFEPRFRNGQIYHHNLGWNRSLDRFIEKQLASWWGNAEGRPVRDIPSFQVLLDRESREGMVSCRIEVSCGNERWVGTDGGHSVHVAILKSLAKMRNLGLGLKAS